MPPRVQHPRAQTQHTCRTAAGQVMTERRAPKAIPHNLPLQLTTFVGRGREKSEVGRLLASNRLVTLMGAGGAGKTRLALAVASDNLDRFPDGVWLVELAPLVDPALVARTAAAVLGIADQEETALLSALANFLRHRRLLLILDNCEHLIAAASQFAETLLRSCPEIHLLATSREALGIPGETAWRVPSLSLPEPSQTAAAARLREYEAIQLFEARAQASRPDFHVTPGNAEAVVQVCRRLDGIPLAIELAAARLNVLTAEQLAAKLDDRFRLLTGGSRSALPRQQTLRAAMDWSYELLSEPERALLRRLSVFAGGCTLEAAEAVCCTDLIGSADILDLLGRLVDKSLVFADEQDGEARYRLLETVRQYARDRLVESGDAAEARRRHRDWYLALVERSWPPGSDQRTTLAVAWLDRLEREHDNLRAALEWSAGEPDGTAAEIRLAAPLWPLWHARVYFAEGRRWLEHALSRNGDLPPVARRTAMHGAALFAWRQADYGRARALASAALDESRAAGDKIGTSDALMQLGLVALRGEEDFPAATSLFEQALVLAKEAGDQFRTAMNLAQLSAVARYRGSYGVAIARAEEARDILEAMGSPEMVPYILRMLGHALAEQGDLDQAAGLYAESLGRFQHQRYGPTWSAAECIEGMGAIAIARGQAERAARLFAAADNFRQTRGYPRRSFDHRRYAEQIAAVRTALGEATFTSASADGRKMTLEEAVDYALTAADPERAGERGTPAKAAGSDPLTAREREVAALVALGHTNREIAAALVVSERTADAHVQNILNKLGFSSRAQIAAWAVERGLQGPATADAPLADAPPRPPRARHRT